MKSSNVFFPLNKVSVGIGLLSSIFLVPLSVSAQSDPDVPAISPSSSRGMSQTEIDNAKPYINPLPPPDTTFVRPAMESSILIPGAVPGVMKKQGGTVGPRAFGTFGVPFTSKRVTHRHTTAVGPTTGNYLSATYPYRAIGRLTFNAGYCSASLIRRSVIVTAAHCMQEFGSGANMFSGWTFTPAYYGTAVPTAPYGSWPYATWARPASWANGTDIGSGAARDNDLAVLILKKNSQNQFIGDIVGYFTYGWNNYSFVRHTRTGNLWTAALTTSGYPFLLDAGKILQRSDGPSYLTTINGAGQVYQGSNFTGGSSGGPWMANFGYQNPSFAGGANGGNQSVNNVIVGVTSWGTEDPNVPKDNYSSQFRQNTRYPLAAYGTFGAGNIASLLNSVCSLKPSGSALTYQQLGYCN